MILTNPLVLNDRNMDSEALVPVFKRQKAAFHTRLPLRTAPKSVTTLRAQRHKSIIRMIVMRRRYWSREKKEKFISLLGKPRRRSAVYRTRRSLGGAPKENRQFSLEFLDDLGDPDNFILLSVGADRRDKAAVDRSQTFVDVANTAFGFFQIVFVVELVDACGEADFTVEFVSDLADFRQLGVFDGKNLNAKAHEDAKEIVVAFRNRKPNVETEILSGLDLLLIKVAQYAFPEWDPHHLAWYRTPHVCEFDALEIQIL
jgi:hypothetical protein